MNTMHRLGMLGVVVLSQVAHAQINPNDVPEPPTEALSLLQPYFGSYAVTGDYAGQQWTGSLDVRPAVKGWYVEWEINAQATGIDRQLRMLMTWDRGAMEYRIWRFETVPPSPSERAEGRGRFEGDEFLMEWSEPSPQGQAGIFRNRVQRPDSDTLVLISEGELTSGDGEVIVIGTTTARRRL